MHHIRSLLPAASLASLAVASLAPAAAHCSTSSTSTSTSSGSGSGSGSGQHPRVHVERAGGGITVLYSDKAVFNKKMAHFVKGGAKQLQVVSDFDFTMSRFRIADKRASSCHRLIEGSGFLPDHIVHQADALFNYYYPLEIDPLLPLDEKVEHMTQWATKGAALMVESGLKRTEIKLAVSEALRGNSFGLRDGVPTFLTSLTAQGVPLLLFSAGIGDIIEETLMQVLGKVPVDVHIVSNHMKFDKDGEHLVGWTAPVFHVFNKKASAALHSPFFQKFDLTHRNNVLLVGDSTGDVHMSEGLQCTADSVIRVGFLNDRVERLPDYLEIYDVVILGDPGFGLVNSLLETIVKAK
jgi:HAD superfamily hydrolase (TIGR01544 family)